MKTTSETNSEARSDNINADDRGGGWYGQTEVSQRLQEESSWYILDFIVIRIKNYHQFLRTWKVENTLYVLSS